MGNLRIQDFNSQRFNFTVINNAPVTSFEATESSITL